VEEAEQRDKEYQCALDDVQDITSLVMKTPWQRYVKWAEMFLGRDMKELHALTDMPKSEDVTERLIVGAVDGMVRNCWDGFHDCVRRGWKLLAFWLASAVRGKEDTKPFRAHIAPYTLQRYIGYWQGYLLFCWRMYKLGDTAIQFTMEQRALLMQLERLLESESELESELESKSEVNGKLMGVLLKLSVALICHSDYAHEKSSLLYYSGVRGYNVDNKQWRQPNEYTTILAGLQFCMRIIMLESALPTAERHEFNERTPLDPVQTFLRVRNKWLIDGESISPQNMKG
jgi:hypothetical protein